MEYFSKIGKGIFCLVFFAILFSSAAGQISLASALNGFKIYRASAYCHGSMSCKIVGKGKTATGNKVRRGIIAADPRVIPLRSKVQIISPKEYAGIYDVFDTGRDIVGNRLDIWVPSQREAIKFGRKKVLMRVLPKDTVSD